MIRNGPGVLFEWVDVSGYSPTGEPERMPAKLNYPTLLRWNEGIRAFFKKATAR